MTENMYESMDASLLPLFQMEAESQCVSLNEGIMALENDPNNQDVLDGLMRAAHALKGAAAVVGLHAAVKLAHAMEDCFTAAMKGNIECDANTIDILLTGTDTLSTISELDIEGFARWQQEQQAAAESLAEDLHNISLGNAVEIASKPVEEHQDDSDKAIDINTADKAKTEQEAHTQSHQPQASATVKKASHHAQVKNTSAESTVRLSSQRLDALLGISGEIQLSAQEIEPIQQDFLHLQKDVTDMGIQLQKLRHQCQDNPVLKRNIMTVEKKFQRYLKHFSSSLDGLYDFERKLFNISQRLSYEVLDSRMQKFGDVSASLQRLVRDTARTLGKSVRLEIQGEDCHVDRDIMEQIQAPLQHILRNAVDHGIELPEQRLDTGKQPEALIQLSVYHQAGMLHIHIDDDGQGIDLEKLRQSILDKGLSKPNMVANMNQDELLDFLLLPQFSMKKEVSNISGRGVGLDLVANTIRLLRGQLRIHSHWGKGSCFEIHLPLSLSIVRCLLVEIHNECYGIHLARIGSIEHIERHDIHYAESCPYMLWRDEQVGLISATQLLGWSQQPLDEALHVIVLEWEKKHYGLVVDQVVGESALIERKLDERLGKIKNISSGAVDSKGQPLLLLDMDDVLVSMQTLIEAGKLDEISHLESDISVSKKRILIVEDSITVREAERRMLENCGYHVLVAVDGMDGWNTLRGCGHVDLIITDIDMPRMNGIELLRLIRSDYAVPDIPVMVVSYKDREEDRLAGMDAGANYYLTKSSFHDNTMLQGVHDLIGEAV